MLRLLTFSALILFLLPSFRIDRPQELWKAPAYTDSLFNPYHIEPLTLPQAQEIYVLHCSSCHGSQGKGDGPGTRDLKTKVPGFQEKHVRAQADGNFYWKIKTGRGEMPGFAKVVSDEQLWQLTEYVRDLSKPYEEQMNPFKSRE